MQSSPWHVKWWNVDVVKLMACYSVQISEMLLWSVKSMACYSGQVSEMVL